jgi:signal transduction histidine kinase
MKSNVVFPLENSGWPALLVDGSAVVARANPAAIKIFGPVLEGDAPRLSVIWSPENGGTPEQFLLNWERSPQPVTVLKLRVKGGGVALFPVSICAFTQGGEKNFIWQLPPENSASEADLVNKQKFDCALQMARTVSLDFNNALTSILGHTSHLLGKTDAEHPWRHSLLEVEKSASRAAEIANDLAIFSQQGKGIRQAPPGNLNAVVNHCVEFFRGAGGGQIVLKTQLEQDLFAVRFDEAKVQQALMKILENAVESASGGNGQVLVQSRNVVLPEPTQDRNVRLMANAYVCVEIADNGCGIAPDVLPRIFEPFFTTKKAPHRGLGLALVYGIVTNHGGGVAVSSQPGTGTSARVYLPAEKHVVRESADTDENLNGTETVLVVDDEDILLTMAETILSEYGYHVLTANSAQKALAILSRHDAHVDLVVTDLVMPTMGGRELVERIRQLLPQIHILCASGCILPPEQQTGLPFLQKPYTSRELLNKVRQALAIQNPEHVVD